MSLLSPLGHTEITPQEVEPVAQPDEVDVWLKDMVTISEDPSMPTLEDKPMEYFAAKSRQIVREKASHEDANDIDIAGIGAMAAIAVAKAVEENADKAAHVLHLPKAYAELAAEESHAIVVHETGAALTGKHHMDEYPLEVLKHSKDLRDTRKDRRADPVGTLAGSKVGALIELKEDESLQPELSHIDPDMLKFMQECLHEMWANAASDSYRKEVAEAAFEALKQKEQAAERHLVAS